MRYASPKSDEEFAYQLLGLRTKIDEIKNKYPYPDEDGRKSALNALTWIISSAIMRFNIILALKNNKIKPNVVQSLIGLKKGDLKTALEADLTFTKLSLVAIFQFQIENLFKIILSNLTKNKPPQGYYNIVEKIVTALDLKDSEKKLETMNFLAYMRNCLHSNGIHTKPSKTFEIEGQKFEFIQGKQYEGGDWAEIAFAVDRSIDIVEEILDHQKIKGISNLLPSQYFPKLDEL